MDSTPLQTHTGPLVLLHPYCLVPRLVNQTFPRTALLDTLMEFLFIHPSPSWNNPWNICFQVAEYVLVLLMGRRPNDIWNAPSARTCCVESTLNMNSLAIKLPFALSLQNTFYFILIFFLPAYLNSCLLCLGWALISSHIVHIILKPILSNRTYAR